MVIKKYASYLWLVSLLLVAGCANIVPPLGGPKDEIPPGIDSLRSTPDFQTNFTPARIELAFDEWIKLEDVFNQVVVSPPLNTAPEITLHGRTVRVTFDKEEVLRENVTYTINFGNAVKDLTEGNPAKDLRFVFSTGPFIDSLSVRGVVRDAYTGDPIENVLLMLYDNLSDTVVRTQRPFYFGKTNKEGQVAINNIKSGTFKVMVLSDGNLNYLFDSEAEKIGFTDKFITLPDSSLNSLNFRLFESTRHLRLVERQTNDFGRVTLVFSRPPEGADIRFYDINTPVWQETEGDTLYLWHNATTPWTAIVTTPGKLPTDPATSDTVYVKAVDNTDFLAQAKLTLAVKGASKQNARGKIAGASTNTALQVLHPLQAARLDFTHPLAIIDTARIRLLEDTTLMPVAFRLQIDSINKRSLNVQYAWKEGKSYRLDILPGGLTDIYGLGNDTIIQKYAVQLLKSYGSVRIKVNGLDSSKQYVFQLFTNEKVAAERIATDRPDYEALISALSPGSYSLRIIEDINRNGRWDTGDYNAQRQPEKIKVRKIKELLRPDWELEVEEDWE